ncbi:MAG: metal-dependent hydrolase [Planctomycetes bacterium]|nr:metal-dependent hydrolase [Planctomycetota bacterium]
MDSLTHTLSGIVVSSLGLRQEFRWPGFLVFTAATLFPDIDFIFNFIARSIYVRFHRGFTHSFIYLPVFALLLAVIFYFLFKSIGFKNLYLICLAGIAMHLLLDVVNSYGTPVLMPFSSAQYSLNLDVIIDAYVLGPLLLGAVAVWVWPSFQKPTALIVLAVMLSGFLFRFIQQQQAARLIARIESSDRTVLIPAGMGTIYNPFTWQAIIPHDNGYNVYAVNSAQGQVAGPHSIAHQMDEINTFRPNSRAVRDFLNWSRFPFGRVEQTDAGTVVKLGDLRFQFGTQERYMLLVRFNKDGTLVSEKFGFSHRLTQMDTD